MHKPSPFILTILLIGLVLRLMVALSGDPIAEYTQGGGDTGWYLANGEGLLTGNDEGVSHFGIPYLISQMPTPPLYLMFVGVFQKIASPENAIILIRITQALLGMLTAFAASRIAWRLTGSKWGAVFTLVALTFDPAQILEPRNITTETLYTALIVGALWVYIEVGTPLAVSTNTNTNEVGTPLAVSTNTNTNEVGTPLAVSANTNTNDVGTPLAVSTNTNTNEVGTPLAVSANTNTNEVGTPLAVSSLPLSLRRGVGVRFAFVGLLLGLATLTRAVGILFPLVLVAHLLWIYRKHWRHALKTGAVLLVVYTVTISTWTAYNLARYDRFVIVSNQFMPAVWRGAVNDDGSPQQNDALLLPTPDASNPCSENCGVQVPTSTYVEQTSNAISANPLGYLANRLRELANAILLPYATTYLGGESLRDLLGAWVQSGFSGDGFMRLVNGDEFWLKLLIYLWQFAGYGLAMVGAWRTRHNFGVMGVPLAFIVYTLAIHVILLALPRYIFPILPCCWILASGVLPRKEVQKVTKGLVFGSKAR